MGITPGELAVIVVVGAAVYYFGGRMKLIGNADNREEASTDALASLGPTPSSQLDGTQHVSPAIDSQEERLNQLNDLRSKGLLSDSEYDQKKKEIIDSL